MHMMQRLDVGLFAPMKKYWKKKLDAAKDEDPSTKLLAKTVFPKMLKELMKTRYLVPLDPSQVIDSLPSQEKSLNVSSTLDRVLLKKLETRRSQTGNVFEYEVLTPPSPPSCRKYK